MKGVCAVIFYLCVLNAERMPSPGRPQGLILRLRSCVQINVSSCSSVAMRSTHLLDQYVKYIPAANAGGPHLCNLDQSPYGGETGGGSIMIYVIGSLMILATPPLVCRRSRASHA
jgi:hypothetical protein